MSASCLIGSSFINETLDVLNNSSCYREKIIESYIAPISMRSYEVICSPNMHSLLQGISDLQANSDYIYVLDKIYAFRNYYRVSNFLSANKHLVNLLIEASGQIKRFFGENVKIELDVFTDNGDQELFGFINTNLMYNDAEQLLSQFDETWWIDASIRGRHCLNFDVEYV